MAIVERLFGRVLQWPVPSSDVADLLVEAGNAIKDEVAKVERLEAALAECREYFADRADVTGSTDAPMEPNAELRVLQAIDAAMEGK